ncbi:MAG TPA: single-stranded DNA-binding protein [Ktedonobacteraceae bacterium]|nr:single-stranded DNA-binding protein [Ktedonobacteraceae bacterium]
MSMAQLSIIGNLGRDPEMSYTPDGTAIVKFSVAVTRKTKDKESTTWFNCVAFRKQAETINTYVRKGQQVYIQGEFVPREYTDRNSVPRMALDVQVEKFQFIGNKPAAPAGVAAGSSDADVLGDGEEHPF